MLCVARPGCQATPARAALQANYGKHDPAAVAKVKEVYGQMGLEARFHAYEQVGCAACWRHTPLALCRPPCAAALCRLQAAAVAAAGAAAAGSEGGGAARRTNGRVTPQNHAAAGCRGWLPCRSRTRS